MKNTIAVTVGLRYRFQDFEIGTILECKGSFYIKTTGKYPLVDLTTEFSLLNMGSRLTITIFNKQRLRLRNKYKRVKRSVAIP
jgi:hypothetical protein